MLLGNIVEFMITKMKNVRCRGGCHLTSVVWLIIFCFFTAAFAKTPVRFVLVPSFPPFILHFFLFVCVFVERKKEPEEREILERDIRERERECTNEITIVMFTCLETVLSWNR